MHAYAVFIRETKSGRRFARFFPLRIFMGACNQEKGFGIFMVGVVTVDTRSAFPEIT